MQFFPFAPMDLLGSALLTLPHLIFSKLLFGAQKWCSKEVVYILFSVTLAAIFTLISHHLGNTPFHYLLVIAPNYLSIFFYSFKIIAKPLGLSFFLATASFFIVLLIEAVLVTIQIYLLDLPSVLETVQLMVYILVFHILAITTSLLLKQKFRNLLTHITQSKRLQRVATLTALLVLFFSLVIINIQHFFGITFSPISWPAAFIISYAITTFICFFLYTKALHADQRIRKKEIQQQALLRYMEESQNQQAAMRKFKHDYQNILFSLREFIQAEDTAGLKQYFCEKIEPASKVIKDSTFALEQLRNIKVPEIQGILAAKLTMAQHLGIDAKFESVEEIDHIAADSLVLVRMLGIILDNAIEELESLGKGQLLVCCFKEGDSLTIIAQNTCRTDIQKLHELKQSGFSTKDTGRGLGLSNLTELVAAHSDELTLQTSIKDGNFTQKLLIGDTE